MKTALLVAGQVRSSRDYDMLLDNIIAPMGISDIYLATWDESPVADFVRVFHPKKAILLSPDIFPRLKQDFWDAYKTHQPNQLTQTMRYKILSGQASAKNHPVLSRDNTLRMFYLNTKVVELVDGSYDCLVKARPDQRILSIEGKIPSMTPGVIYAPAQHYRDDHKGKYSCDQFFFGEPGIMTKTMNIWNELPRHLATVEDPRYTSFHYKHNHSWLSPEVVIKSFIETTCMGRIVPFDIGCTVKLREWVRPPVSVVPITR